MSLNISIYLCLNSLMQFTPNAEYDANGEVAIALRAGAKTNADFGVIKSGDR